MFAQHPQRLPEVAPPQTDAHVIPAEVEHIAGQDHQALRIEHIAAEISGGSRADKLREGD